MLLLPLRQLIAFNDEFSEFFRNQTDVVNLEYMECVYDPSQLVVRFAEHQPAGWVLLRNGAHTYLLIEIGPEKEAWKTSIVPGPKKVLENIQKSAAVDWQSILPLIRQAHKEAHPGKDENLNFNLS
jgi:hypothetical protein